MYLQISMAVLLILILFLLGLRLWTVKTQMRRMAAELEKNREESYNKQVHITLTDEDLISLAIQLNKNLDYQKALKLESEQLKKQLRQSISNIAHDLRTPVTVIKGNLQRLSMEGNLSPQNAEYVRICTEKTDVLRSMVDEFFELSFYESETEDVELKRLDITAFAMQFFVDAEALIRENDIHPRLTFPEKSLFIEANEALLSRIFGNLLGNILKHTKESFSFALTEEKDTVGICFANPVNPSEKPDVAHIFERTYRGDKARTGGGAGGLGLFIVKLLADKQHAGIAASCDEELKVEILFKKAE